MLSMLCTLKSLIQEKIYFKLTQGPLGCRGQSQSLRKMLTTFNIVQHSKRKARLVKENLLSLFDIQMKSTNNYSLNLKIHIFTNPEVHCANYQCKCLQFLHLETVIWYCLKLFRGETSFNCTFSLFRFLLQGVFPYYFV